jgi:spore photoproduct lyase
MDVESALGGIEAWFTEFYIHEQAWNSPAAVRARSVLTCTPQMVSERPDSLGNRGILAPEAFSQSKKRLYMGPHEGHFFRKCPGTFGAACCNYFVLNLGVQCNMNCSYCYLQSYINSPLTQIYTNIDRALGELNAIVEMSPRAPFRVGTGEMVDSLSLDDLTHYSAVLVEWFRSHPHLTCEFKTKSDNVKNFLNVPHAENVVVSFSVNPKVIVDGEEHGTASLKQRLAAAVDVRDKGFPVAFHIDPMIAIDNWRERYSELVAEICELFTAREVKWISVGALRFLPDMRHAIRSRFSPKSHVVRAELWPASDGKLRYRQGLRQQMFQHVLDAFRRVDPRYSVFLCMETPESWLGTFGETPRQVASVERLFEPIAVSSPGTCR